MVVRWGTSQGLLTRIWAELVAHRIGQDLYLRELPAFTAPPSLFGMTGHQNSGFRLSGPVIPGNPGLAGTAILAWHTAAGPEHVYLVDHRTFRANTRYKTFTHAKRLIRATLAAHGRFAVSQRVRVGQLFGG